MVINNIIYKYNIYLYIILFMCKIFPIEAALSKHDSTNCHLEFGITVIVTFVTL